MRAGTWRVAALVLLLLGVAACASLTRPLENPRLTVTSLKLLPPQGLEQRIVVGLKVLNPNGLEIRASGMAIDLSLNGVPVLSGAASELPKLPPYGEASFDVTLSTSLMNSLRLLEQVSRNPDQPMQYSLRARLDMLLPVPRSLDILEQGAIAARPPASMEPPGTAL